jgi:pilus assembly protein CpaB
VARFELLLKPKFMILFAILLSGLATIATYRFIQQQKEQIQGQQEQRIKLQKIIVAQQDLQMGTMLNETLLVVAEWPEDIIPLGSFSSMDLVAGRVLKSPVFTKEPILEAKLAPPGSEGGFSSIIPLGMRAATVAVNVVSGVSGFVLPGTYVDVVTTVSPSSNKEETASKIILENVKVLAVDQLFERKDDDPMTVQSVTLLVNPEQSEKLVLASTEGKLQLTMRNRADSSETNTTPGIWLKDLIAANNPPPPPVRVSTRRTIQPTKQEPVPAAVKEARPQPRKVEVIRATKKEEITFDSEE